MNEAGLKLSSSSLHSPLSTLHSPLSTLHIHLAFERDGYEDNGLGLTTWDGAATYLVDSSESNSRAAIRSLAESAGAQNHPLGSQHCAKDTLATNAL